MPQQQLEPTDHRATGVTQGSCDCHVTIMRATTTTHLVLLGVLPLEVDHELLTFLEGERVLTVSGSYPLFAAVGEKEGRGGVRL